MTVTSFFQRETPYHSLISLCQQAMSLSLGNRTDALSNIQSFFCEKAFKGAYIKISNNLIPHFFEAVKELKRYENANKYFRLILNIEMVAREQLNLQKTTVQIDLINDSGNTLSSHWLPMSNECIQIFKNFERIETSDDKRLKIKTKTLTPSIIQALMGLPASLKDNKDAKSYLSETPIPSLVELLCYVSKNQISSIKEFLFTILPNMNPSQFRLFSDSIVPYLKNEGIEEVLIALKRKLQPTLPLSEQEYAEIEEINKKIGAETQLPTNRSSQITVPRNSTPPKIVSPYFDPEHPFESIAQFSDRFTMLSRKDQCSFVQSVLDFFEAKIFNHEKVPFPEKLGERFAKIDLPFLLNQLEKNNTSMEETRLISNIQRAISSQFTFLGQKQVYCVQTREPNSPFSKLIWLKKDYIEVPSANGLTSSTPSEDKPLAPIELTMSVDASEVLPANGLTFSMLSEYKPLVPIELTMSADASFALQVLQHSPVNRYLVNLNEWKLLTVNFLKELFLATLNQTFKPYNKKICEAIKLTEVLNVDKTNFFREFSSSIIKDFVKDSKFEAFKKSDLPFLKPSNVSDLDKDLVKKLLDFNISRSEYVESIFRCLNVHPTRITLTRKVLECSKKTPLYAETVAHLVINELFKHSVSESREDAIFLKKMILLLDKYKDKKVEEFISLQEFKELMGTVGDQKKGNLFFNLNDSKFQSDLESFHESITPLVSLLKSHNRTLAEIINKLSFLDGILHSFDHQTVQKVKDLCLFLIFDQTDIKTPLIYQPWYDEKIKRCLAGAPLNDLHKALQPITIRGEFVKHGYGTIFDIVFTKLGTYLKESTPKNRKRKRAVDS